MGEAARADWDGKTRMFNTRITYCHWTALVYENDCSLLGTGKIENATLLIVGGCAGFVVGIIAIGIMIWCWKTGKCSSTRSGTIVDENEL